MYDYFNVDVLEALMEELRLWLPESNVPKKTESFLPTREMETWQPLGSQKEFIPPTVGKISRSSLPTMAFTE